MSEDSIKCMPNCTDAAPVVSIDNICRKCLPTDGGIYWDGTKCVSSCPQTHNASNVCKSCAVLNSDRPYWTGSVCTPCRESTPKWDGSKCVTCTSINPTKPYWTGISCDSCPDDAIYYYEGSCLKTCPEDAPLEGENHQCQTCADVYKNRPVWDPNTKVCESKCSTDTSSWSVFVCKTCEEYDYRKPVFANGTCFSCPEISMDSPIWDEASRTCRSCSDIDGGRYWEDGRCTQFC